MGVILSLTRQHDIGYHVAEAEAWLAECDEGRRSTLLAFAAFGLRLEIERIALELLGRIRGNRLLSDDEAAIRRFGTMESRIYDLEGHQHTIDRKVAFANVLLGALNAPLTVQRINLGQLRRDWHACSEFCHITWTLEASIGDQAAVCSEGFVRLSAIRERVRLIVHTGITWPRMVDPSFAELQEQYVRGEADDAAVLVWLRQHSAWAQVQHSNGDSEFVGRAIPPTD